MATDFRDSTVLVTGGGSGIGLGLGLALAEQGARIGLIGTDRGKLDRALERLNAVAERAAAAVLDVTDGDAWPAALQRIESALGPVDSLVLNAGAGSGGMLAESTPLAVWDWLLDVNLKGVVHGLHACLPGMKARGRAGHVLFTASISAATQPPTMSAYTASKAAVVALAQTLRAELAGSALGVSVLLPAAVRTEFSKTSARGAPEALQTTEGRRVFERMQGILDAGLDPLEVGRFAVKRMREGGFYIFTHAKFRDEVAAAQAELLAAMPMHADLDLGPSPGSAVN